MHYALMSSLFVSSRCAFGFYDPPQCKPCDCFLNGTYGDVCEVGGGQCPCKDNFDGPACDKCADGYWNFPECERKFNLWLVISDHSYLLSV